jgi:hypothetical protein
MLDLLKSAKTQAHTGKEEGNGREEKRVKRAAKTMAITYRIV